ncbi:type IV toxin-antitoxin system AbiEi family antitoxin domain-containing protein [Acetobacterium wieringae]|uniref:type IV toxin-antitoxin system AbiEi family antitoxin domain-containing protein n=1 Tax=Acetobacterium wieringae TaxID=52694 RepID=UPI0026F23B35|nr:type IV toxin-antitoxin system AbiEi family antitoxin domain-containing protein [Acetobacterium wieringae]
MMNDQNKLETLIYEKDGLILTKDVVCENILSAYLYKEVKKGRLIRIRRGVFITEDAWNDY